MRRYLAIRVERPRRGFATLLRLRKAGMGRRGFTPLTASQTSADVRFYQIDQQRRRQRVKSLETVRIEDLVRSGHGRDGLTIEARYDGASSVEVVVTEQGRPRKRLTLSVRREPRRPWWLLILFLIPALFFGVRLRGGMDQRRIENESDAGPVAAPIATERPSVEPTMDVRPDDADEPARSPEAASPVDTVAAAEPSPVVTTEATIYFTPNSVDLTSDARRRISALAGELPIEAEWTVSIVGHAAPFGSEAGRSDISEGRARAVYDALRTAGWRPSVAPNLEWYGASEPVTMELSRQNLNRRVEIRVFRR